MSLVFDARDALAGGSGFHALIVGVSAYRHLPPVGAPPLPQTLSMTQLSSAAFSAYKIYKWLVQNRDYLSAPLATCRLLLAPTADELAREPNLRDGLPATLHAFLQAAREWRNDVCANTSQIAFFYFAGHGVIRNRTDQILLLEDFNDGYGSLLRNSTDVNSLLYGMAPSRQYPNIGRTQFYFIDACRNLPRQFTGFESLSPTPAFDVHLPDLPDNRIAPIFYAATVGSVAFAEPGVQTIFSQALLSCLQGAAAERDYQGRWRVTSSALERQLQWEVNALVQKHSVEMSLVVDGLGRDAVLCYLPHPPQARLQLFLKPPSVHTHARVQIRDGEGTLLYDLPPPIPTPYEALLAPGYYQFELWRDASQLAPDKQAIRAIRYPLSVVELEAL
ncbi:MAG: hypothetical protein KatS3mg017_0484 [Fimbriimonadales bacterium]|nr:MAG: hypothetical protein KatS3mg017_0484 [Fimbriimonadales bacterium]GIV07973.1 MAG: hypothetical protein KatS3mg019_0064 [Fimbriimonadales bacterium]